MTLFHVCSTSGHDSPVFEDPGVIHDLFRGVRAVTEAGVRIVAYAIMSSHIHLLIEAQDAARLASAMNRILAPMAQNLNRRLQQRGGVFCHKFWRMPAESDAYRWVLPLYVHGNPSPHSSDLRRLDVGPRSSHAAWVDGYLPGWLMPGELRAQYGDDYLPALRAYLEQRSERATARVPLGARAECGLVAVARVCGVRPATLQDPGRGGKRDRMLLAWTLAREISFIETGCVLGVDRETASRWARVVAKDSSFAEARTLLGG